MHIHICPLLQKIKKAFGFCCHEEYEFADFWKRQKCQGEISFLSQPQAPQFYGVFPSPKVTDFLVTRLNENENISLPHLRFLFKQVINYYFQKKLSLHIKFLMKGTSHLESKLLVWD